MPSVVPENVRKNEISKRMAKSSKKELTISLNLRDSYGFYKNQNSICCVNNLVKNKLLFFCKCK